MPHSVWSQRAYAVSETSKCSGFQHRRTWVNNGQWTLWVVTDNPQTKIRVSVRAHNIGFGSMLFRPDGGITNRTYSEFVRMQRKCKTMGHRLHTTHRPTHAAQHAIQFSFVRCTRRSRNRWKEREKKCFVLHNQVHNPHVSQIQSLIAQRKSERRYACACVLCRCLVSQCLMFESKRHK